MDRWRGKVALVTGASSGIGKAIAHDLAKGGMKLVLLARRADRLTELARDLGHRYSAQVLTIPTDLRDVGAIESAFLRAVDELGGVDVLVNSAGLGHEAPLTAGDAEAWREMLDVNVLALCVCTREAVADMRRREDYGHVFHISSMSGHRVPAGSGVYGATKYAVRSLTESLRQELRELGSDIRVTAISPGIVETEFHAHFLQDEEAAKRNYARFEVLQPEDVAAAVCYALSAPPRAQVHDVLVRPTRQPT